MIDHFGRLENQFFAEDDLAKFNKELKDGVFQKSKVVKKHTRIENGERTTITETKTVEPNGKKTHVIKEETDDGKGHRQVRYLDALPEHHKKQIKNHPNAEKEDLKKIHSKNQQ
jgi:hypothetical protein